MAALTVNIKQDAHRFFGVPEFQRYALSNRIATLLSRHDPWKVIHTAGPPFKVNPELDFGIMNVQEFGNVLFKLSVDFFYFFVHLYPQPRGVIDMKLFAVSMALIVFSTGCASIFNGTTETIYVRSTLPDTVFYANSREIGRGTMAVTSIPKKKLKSTMLRAEKDGCDPAVAPIETAFDATTLLGVLIDWGIVSVLIVDGAGTGAITKAARNDYVLTPLCLAQNEPSQKVD